MRVWIINPFDNLPHEGYRAQRYWLMCKGFAAAGDEVVFWTSDFSHASKRKRELRREIDAPGVTLRLVPTLPYRANIGLARIASHWKLARTWLRMAREEASRNGAPTIVVASLPPLGLCRAAMEFSRGCGAFFAADIMDAWPETFERVAPRALLAPLRAVAREIYRGADAIGGVAARYIELAKSHGARAPSICSYHGIELAGDALTRLASLRDERAAARGAPLKLAYIGAMGASYDLETVVDAIASPGETATLELAGSGPKEEALRRRAASCPRIHFHGYLDAPAVEALLARAEIGLVPMFPESCVGIPYKLADYAAAGLRIAECLGGETQRIVAAHSAGEHYAAGDAASFAAALAKLKTPAAEWDPCAFAQVFDSRRIMADYVAFCHDLARTPR